MKPAIVLTTLRAEGGPALAAGLAAEWAGAGMAPEVVVLSGRDRTMAPAFEALGVRVTELDHDRIGPRHWPSIARDVARALRRLRADAVVSIPNGVHGAIFAGAALAGVRRRVVHVGNYPWHWQHGFWKYRATMRASAPVTPNLICVTGHVREGVQRHFGRVARRTHVVPNGIDLDRFAFTPRPIRTEGPLVVTMVGRLDGGKDHVTLIRAVAVLKARGTDVQLRLVGEGALGDTLRKGACTEGAADRIAFLGARSDVPDLLAGTDVFAFSVRPEEGLGIALVEAMAAGTRIAATDVGACREVLDGGRCGRLVPENDPEAWADAILEAARDETRVRAARARAEAVYSRRAMAEGYARVLGLS